MNAVSYIAGVAQVGRFNPFGQVDAATAAPAAVFFAFCLLFGLRLFPTAPLPASDYCLPPSRGPPAA